MIPLPNDFENFEEAEKFLTRVGLLVHLPGTGLRGEDIMLIGKPRGIGGREVEGYDARWNMKIPLSCPPVKIFHENAKWSVSVRQYKPGPGLGDFIHDYSSLGNAVKCAIDWLGL